MDTINHIASKTSISHNTRNRDVKLVTETKRNGGKAAQIAADLRAGIICGAFPPGEILRQEDLAQRFQSSRMPIRDSLRILEQEGLVELPTNRGARVSRLSAVDFEDISSMRSFAEPLALRYAIPNLTNRQIELAAGIQAQAEKAPIEQFAKLNHSFHLALVEPCNRPKLLAHIVTLSDQNMRYLRYATETLDYANQSHTEHNALLSACYLRDSKAASQLLKTHIESASRALLELLPDLAL